MSRTGDNRVEFAPRLKLLFNGKVVFFRIQKDPCCLAELNQRFQLESRVVALRIVDRSLRFTAQGLKRSHDPCIRLPQGNK